jgi:two-component system, OmpR family, copper resistance phosphate regulon response regulator CusR
MQVLLVEDEARLARNYQRNLEDEGHVVEVLYDGETACAHIVQESDRFDIVVMDVLLPGMSGIEVCRAVRAEHIRVPILLLTALDQTEEKVAGLDAGADDYLTKPFPFEELLARMRALARRPYRFDPVAEATQLHCGDLVVDLMRHEVWRGNTLIPLTAREFVLLEFLVRHSGRVLTRQQLTDRVWPDGTEAGSNILDTYIHYLREKIDRDFPTRLLHTIRGVGYMVRMPSAPTSSSPPRQTAPVGESARQEPEPPDESS